MKKVTRDYKYEFGSKGSYGNPVLIISRRSKSVFENDKIQRIISGSMAEEIFSWVDDKYIVDAKAVSREEIGNDMYPHAKKLGVTATPWRMNNGGFESVFDKIIISQSIQSFIDAGWLAPYDYYSISYNSEIQKEIESITEFDVEGDYKISALEKKIDTSRIRAQLLDSYLKFAKGKKGIIYSVSRKHSDHICQEYREAGINIVRIDSKTPKDERKLYVDRFRKGLIDIIVNVDIFSEGFDCPDIEFIQLARPTKSLVKYLQQVGRGLRPTAGKSICLILDNVGLHFQFGLPNSNRNWEESFVGSPHIPTRRNSSGGSILIEHKERNFSEGTDEMQLIVASQRKHEETIKQWSDKDQELLKTLYEEKQCPIEILVAIFKRSEEEIRNKLSELTNREYWLQSLRSTALPIKISPS